MSKLVLCLGKTKCKAIHIAKTKDEAVMRFLNESAQKQWQSWNKKQGERGSRQVSKSGGKSKKCKKDLGRSYAVKFDLIVDDCAAVKSIICVNNSDIKQCGEMALMDTKGCNTNFGMDCKAASKIVSPTKRRLQGSYETLEVSYVSTVSSTFTSFMGMQVRSRLFAFHIFNTEQSLLIPYINLRHPMYPYRLTR